MTVIPSPVDDEARRDEPFLAAAAVEVEHLEAALLANEFRLVVVRAADLVLPLRDGVAYAAVPRRDTPFDVLLNRNGLITEDLPAGTRVGVLSLAVRNQMISLWPQLDYRLLTGGLDSALERLMRRAEVDALVLPASAAEHLGIQGIVTEIFYPEMILPSAGQGILVVLGREDDREAVELLQKLHSEPTHREMEAEHAFMQRITAEQDPPVGVLAHVKRDRLEIAAAVGSPRSGRVHRVDLEGQATEAESLGIRLAESLLLDAESLIDLLEADFPDGVPPLDGEDPLDGGDDAGAEFEGELDEDLRAELADLDRRRTEEE
jgi:hydroxymethylbilane synthase